MMIWALKQQLNKSLTLVLPFNVALEPRNYPNIFSNFSPCTNLILPACAIQLVPLQYLGLANTSCFVSLFRSAFTVAGVPPRSFSPFFLLLIQPCFRKEAGKAKPRDEAITMTSEAEGLEQTHPHRNLTPK